MSDLPGLLSLAADNTASVVELQPETLAVLLYSLAKIRNPDRWRDYYGEYISDEDRELIHELVDLAADDIMRPLVIPEPIYPKSFIAFGHMAKLVGAGALQHVYNSVSQFAYVTRVVTPYINQEFEVDVLMARGNWRINYMAWSNNSSGQIRLRVDNQDAVFINDYYSAAVAVNLISNNLITVEIPTDGNHKIGFKSPSKNASSSNYNFNLQAVWGTWVSAL